MMTMNFSIGMMNGAASVEKQPDTTHWYMWKYPRMHCFGCIIIRRERKSGFLRMKTESRFGGNMGWIVRMKKKMQEFMANDTARSICDACPLMFLSIDDAPFV